MIFLKLSLLLFVIWFGLGVAIQLAIIFKHKRGKIYASHLFIFSFSLVGFLYLQGIV